MNNSPLKSIRRHCLDCCGGSRKMVKNCTSFSCPLWYFRFGVMPKTAVKKYGKKLLNPDSIPSSDISIDSLP